MTLRMTALLCPLSSRREVASGGLSDCTNLQVHAGFFLQRERSMARNVVMETMSNGTRQSRVETLLQLVPGI